MIELGLLKNELNRRKISLFLDQNYQVYQVNAYNMGPLLSFNDEIITFTNWQIIGQNLIISKLEESEVEIKGAIEKVESHQT